MSRRPQRISRRTLLRSALVGSSGLLAAYLLGCDDGGNGQPSPTETRAATAPPSKGPTATSEGGAFGWFQLSPSGPPPPPRRDHSLAGDGHNLYLFGGRDTEPLGDLWAYTIELNTWFELSPPNGPPARFGHNAVWDAASSRMLVFGGQAGSEFFNDLWAFDRVRREWTELTPGGDVPAARYGAGAAFDPTDGGRMLVTHGFTASGRFDDTWRYDLDGQAWADVSPGGQRPVERCLMRAAWDPGAERLLMFGGQTTETPFLGDLWALGASGWTELTAEPKPSPRNFYAMAFDDGANRLVLFGGKTEQGPANDLWLFDSAGESWSQPPVNGEAPSARSGHDAVWVPTMPSLLVFGGNDGSANLNDLWEFSASA